LQVIVLEQLNALLVLQDLNSGDEDLSLEFTVEGRSYSNNHLHIVAAA
jgi:hypothetical protein